MADTKKPDKDDTSPTPAQLNPKQRSRRDFLEGTTAVLGSAVPVLGISTANAQATNTGGCYYLNSTPCQWR